MGLGPARRDIHLDQRMLAPYFSAFKWRCGLAVTESEDGRYIIQPLLVTDKNELRHAYNFGGPISNTNSPPVNLINEHVEGVRNWARMQGVTGEFTTLISALAQDQLRLLAPSNVDANFIKDSVYVDVVAFKPRPTTRRMAIKAQDALVTVKSHPTTPENMQIFFDMYSHTMNRVQAKDHWRFTYQWFLAFAKYVRPELLIASFEGKPQSAALVVYHEQYPMPYYHFAASFSKFPSLGINHLLVMAACEFIKNKGQRHLYLGGGTTKDERDSLMMFKSGFSKLRMPVYAYEVQYG